MDVSLLDYSFLVLGALLATFYAYKKGMYTPPLPYRSKPVTIWAFLAVFLFYFVVVNLLFPLLWSVLYAQGFKEKTLAALDLLRIPVAVFALFALFMRFSPSLHTHFFPRQKLMNLLFPSFVSFFISLIWASCVAVGIQLIFKKLGYSPEFQQDAVTALIELKQNGWIFVFQGIGIIFLVPIAEELIFRGYLHEALYSSFGRASAILLSSLAFVVVHATPAQGLGNIPIMAALFPLALHLAFLKERYGSLKAPILCHIFFNAMGVFQIYAVNRLA